MNSSWDEDSPSTWPLWQRPLFRVVLGGGCLLVLGASIGFASARMTESHPKPPVFSPGPTPAAKYQLTKNSIPPIPPAGSPTVAAD